MERYFSDRLFEFYFVLKIAKKNRASKKVDCLIEWSWKPKTVSFYVQNEVSQGIWCDYIVVLGFV